MSYSNEMSNLLAEFLKVARFLAIVPETKKGCKLVKVLKILAASN